MKRLLSILAIVLSIYIIITGYLGSLPSLQHRPLVVGVILFILFLTIDAKGRKVTKPKWYDILFGILAVLCCLVIFMKYEWLLTRYAFVTPMEPLELVSGTILVLLVLEAGRRTIGIILPSIAFAAILYGYLGPYLIGPLNHNGYNLLEIVELLFMTTEGLWGSPTDATVTFVFMFVIFGGLLAATGMGKFFMDISMALTGRFAGGPAKTSVVASALMGTIQGSSISNVVTTGSFTIPTMKKYGFSKTYAGGVESVSSCGGQITPPIMGAAAFVMADMTGIPYIEIAKYALLPALLYYICVFTQVHLRAKQMNLKGLPNKELPSFLNVIKSQGIYILPLIFIVILLINGYSPMRAGFVSIVTLVILALLVSPNRKKVLSKIVSALASAPQNMATVLAAVLNAGIIIGILFMTGLGLQLSSLVINVAQGILPLALLLGMIMAIILGMGMPTTGAYIMLGTLLAPGLVELGLSSIQAHLFVLYFAAMSMLTPPVAVASYAAAGIANADPNKVGFTAWKLAIAAFVVPFMFAYQPSLLLIGTLDQIIIAALTAIIGCICLACAMEGYIFNKINTFERIFLVVAGLFLMNVILLLKVTGILIASFIFITQYLKKKKLDDTHVLENKIGN